MRPGRLAGIGYSGACLLFLGLALAAHDLLFRLGLEYYLRRAAVQPNDQGWLPLCELDTLFQQLGASSGGGQVFAGACDAVLVSGLVAVGGFLAFLAVYFVYALLVRGLLALLPAAWRTGGLILASALFLAVALPVRPALWFLEFGILLCVAAALPLARRARSVLLVALLLGFYVLAGAAILQLTAKGFLHAHALFLDEAGARAVPPALAGLLEFLNLGRLGGLHQDGEGFPYLLPALGLLVTLPRRVAWVAWELWVGRTDRADLPQLYLYLLGLPFLIGNAASPSFADFRRRPDPAAASASGWPTLAWCLGLGALGYTLLVGLGFSPAVRLLFPRCDLQLVSPLWVWARLLLAYVIAFLYLYGTEQTSVGMCRLFGYSVRDNFARPLSARNAGDFWRRWNVLWREFLVTVFFFPTAMARRAGAPRPWHAAVAVGVTFLGTYALNALPLLLLAVGGRMAFTDATHPGPGLTTSMKGTELDDSLQVTALLPALALYYALEAAAVAWNLSWEGRSRRFALPRPLAWGLTLLFVAWARVLLDPALALPEKLDMMSRALFR